MPDRVAVWQVLNAAGAVVSTWDDIPVTAISTRADGPQAITVTVPYRRSLDAPAIDRGLAIDNTVRLWVATPQSQTAGGASGVYGSARYGIAHYGSAVDVARLMYRATIIGWRDQPAIGQFAVTLRPAAAALDTTYVTPSYAGSGCPVRLAREIVRLFTPGLQWDGRNPSSCGFAFGTEGIEFHGRQTVRQVLEQLRGFAGVNWYVYVTPAGSVRFFEPDLSVADHIVTEGVTAMDLDLETYGGDQRYEIIVRYRSGETDYEVIRQSSRYTAANPLTEVINADEVHDDAAAARLAVNTLAERAVAVPRGTLTIVPPYELESIEVGDTIRIQREQSREAGAAGVYGVSQYGKAQYASTEGGPVLVITEVSYTTEAVRIAVGPPLPDPTRRIRAIERDVKAFAGARLLTSA